jgi:hypothetical protein
MEGADQVERHTGVEGRIAARGDFSRGITYPVFYPPLRRVSWNV